MNIIGYNKAEVLAALYNNAKPQGIGVFNSDNDIMGKEEAQKLLDNSTDNYFDYIKGRPLKIDMNGVMYQTFKPKSKKKRIIKKCKKKYVGLRLETWLYDRDNGIGSAELAITNNVVWYATLRYY